MTEGESSLFQPSRPHKWNDCRCNYHINCDVCFDNGDNGYDDCDVENCYNDSDTLIMRVVVLKMMMVIMPMLIAMIMTTVIGMTIVMNMIMITMVINGDDYDDGDGDGDDYDNDGDDYDNDGDNYENDGENYDSDGDAYEDYNDNFIKRKH